MKIIFVLLCSAIASYFIADKYFASISQYIPLNLVIPKTISLCIAPFIHLSFWGGFTAIGTLPYFRRHLKNFATIFISIGLTMFICGVLKIVLGRARPSFWLETGISDFSFFNGIHGHFRSFPSSHAATAFALAYFFGNNLRSYLLATILVSTRIMLNEHYLSDVIVGAVIGIWTAKKTEQVIRLLGLTLKRTKT